MGDALRMRIELAGGPPRAPAWPAGVGVRAYAPEDAPALHALLARGYAGDGFGEVAPFEEWLVAVTGDVEFDSELCFLAEAGGALAGAALCWTSGFVKDLVVDEPYRGRGLGEALLCHALAALAARGAERADLKVVAGNERAIRLYERVGFRAVE